MDQSQFEGSLMSGSVMKARLKIQENIRQKHIEANEYKKQLAREMKQRNKSRRKELKSQQHRCQEIKAATDALQDLYMEV